MYSKFKIPVDAPAACCARCIWWKQTNVQGEGTCAIWSERRWYKCMVCPEYEFDS